MIYKYPDDQAPWNPSTVSHSESVRRKVVDLATDVARGASADGGAGLIPASSGQPAINLYLALLQDRLPVYAHTINQLGGQVGRFSVTENLMRVAHACIEFHTEVLGAKASVLADPDQLLRLRRALKTCELTPKTAHRAISDYLARERRLGRVHADVECDAAAQLLIGACVHYAFTKIFTGDGPPQDVYTASMVDGLRLTA